MNARHKVLTAIVTSVLFFLLPGCCKHTRTASTGPALVAKKYAQERFGFKNPQVGNVGSLNYDYSVWVWDDPRKPGGFVIIHVSKENKVTGWDPGR
jgi:hypothetical protein